MDTGRPPFRYDARLASEIERRWQDRWEREGIFTRRTRPATCPSASRRSPDGPSSTCSTSSRTPAASGCTSVIRWVIIDRHRLAYLAERVVNWCPGLGTVLADEEVTAEGRSAVGNPGGFGLAGGFCAP